MKIAVDLDDRLLADARAFTPGTTPSELVEAALRFWVEAQAASRLADLGGSMPDGRAQVRGSAYWMEEDLDPGVGTAAWIDFAIDAGLP